MAGKMDGIRLAGRVADCLSMGSSGYLAAKAEQEVYAHEIRMEEEELELMPELEKEDLTILYQVRVWMQHPPVSVRKRFSKHTPGPGRDGSIGAWS